MATPGLGPLEILIICGVCTLPIIAVLGVAGALWWMNTQNQKKTSPPPNS
jgi:hypothetical protein